MAVPTNRFAEAFNVEVECWCHGLSQFPGEMNAALVHRVIRELAVPFTKAFENGYTFDLMNTAKQFFEAARHTLPLKEVLFSMLAQLPDPWRLNEDGKFTMAQVIDKVEGACPGALERLERRWRSDAAHRKTPDARSTHTR